ncbi:MAG: transporter [Nitrospirae bacterium]|nr:transporter [Nitrospirota bacterium]
MRRYFVMFLLVLMGYTVSQEAYASGLCCQLSTGVQESLLGVASPKTEEFSFQLTYSFTLMDKFKEGGSDRTLSDLQNKGTYTLLPNHMEMIKETLTTAYGFTPNFTAFISIPHVKNTMNMTMGMGMGTAKQWSEQPMEPVENIGDITAMGLYRIYTNDDKLPTDTITLGAGIKTPTGNYTERGSSGRFIHAHMQTGTGSWDPIFSLMYARMMSPFLIQADVTYQLSNRNPEGYKFGDSLSLNALGKFAISSDFNLTSSLTYLHLNKADDKDGKYTNLKSLMDDPANTGGDSIWFSPGVQALPTKDSMIDIKVQIPVWERVNGTQLVSRYRILLGLSYNF